MTREGKQAFEVRGQGERCSYHDPFLEQAHHYKLSEGLAFARIEDLGALAKAETSSAHLGQGYVEVGKLDSASELVARLTTLGNQPVPKGPQQPYLAAKKRVRTAQALLALDRENLAAAQILIELFDSPVPFVEELAIRAASDALRVEVDDEMYVLTPAFELMRDELLNYLDCKDVSLFVGAMPVLLFERPFSTLHRCSTLLKESKDTKTRETIAGALDRNRSCCLQVRLLDNVRRDWLATETDFELLLGHGHSPLIPVRRVESIIAAGLAHESPTYRLNASGRCTHDLEPPTALRLLREARTDEPDELIGKILDSAINFVGQMVS